MTPDQVMNSLGAFLETMDDCPQVVYPNRNIVPDEHPYLTVGVVRGTTRDERLAGGSDPIRSGRFVVVVVAKKNEFTTTADYIAGLIEAHFSMGTRTSQGLTISGPPHVTDGYPTDTDWRVPVMIPWRTVK